MEAKSSFWLAASLLLFKLVMPFIPTVSRFIRSSFLLKNNEGNNLTEANEQEEETVVAADEDVGELVQLIPDHVIESLLLSLLPVRSLLRFGSVSKHWNYTISSPAFSTQHMVNISHVVYFNFSDYRRFFFSTKNFQLQAAPIPDADRLSSPPSLVEIRHPCSLPVWFANVYTTKGWLLRYISSCNGLVCFLKTSHSRKISIHNVCIQIWNLATNKHRLVGDLPDDVLGMMRGCAVDVDTTMFGFGFDPTINDFKIVFMFRSATTGPVYWITHVMSIKTNIWRKVDTLSSNYHDLSRVREGYRVREGNYGISNNVAVAGGVFWNVYIDDYTDKAILKFSLAEERFELISFPDRKRGTLYDLSCHGRSLYLITQNIDDVQRIDLWMLPIGSASNAWKKVTTIIPPPPYFRIASSYSICEPLGIDCNGHVIIVVNKVLYAYILKESKFVELDSSSNCEYLHLVQMETLASP